MRELEWDETRSIPRPRELLILQTVHPDTRLLAQKVVVDLEEMVVGSIDAVVLLMSNGDEEDIVWIANFMGELGRWCISCRLIIREIFL